VTTVRRAPRPGHAGPLDPRRRDELEVHFPSSSWILRHASRVQIDRQRMCFPVHVAQTQGLDASWVLRLREGSRAGY
jgi:hypothetical protein